MKMAKVLHRIMDKGQKIVLQHFFSFIEKPAYDSRLYGCEKSVIWGRLGGKIMAVSARD